MSRPAPPEQKSLVGQTIGKCKLLRICGRGAMGTVYEGMHSGLDIQVAVKILPPHLAANQNLVGRFLREAKLAARLNHPNTVRVYDVGDEDGYYYLVMEYIEGTDALELVRRHGPQEAAVVADIGAGAARALQVAHMNQVIHRDIKPANLMLPDAGGVKVADFGLARALASDTGLTLTGAIMGTPDYMAPEQAQGTAVGPKADVYSLGATLFHLLVGRPPFAGATPMAVALQHVTNRIVVPEEYVTDDASRKLARLIHEMTQKDTLRRPGDLESIATRLAEVARTNRRTRKLLSEGATIYATTGLQIDAGEINRVKAAEASALVETGAAAPNLDALRKAADAARARGNAPGPQPKASPARSTAPLPPEIAEYDPAADATPRRATGMSPALPRSGETSRMGESEPSRPRSRMVTGQDDGDWEAYSAKAFPTEDKRAILKGKSRPPSASGANWEHAAKAAPPPAADFSRPVAYDSPTVIVSRRAPGSGLLTLLLILAVLGAAGYGGWYYFLRDPSSDPAPVPPPRPNTEVTAHSALLWIAHPGNRAVVAACPSGTGTGWFMAFEDGTISRWAPGKREPEVQTQLPNVRITALAARPDGERLAVGTQSGQVILLKTGDLSVFQALYRTVEGAVSALHYRSSELLLIGSDRGRLFRDRDDQNPHVIANGAPVRSIAHRGSEVWAAAGTTVVSLEVRETSLQLSSTTSELPQPVTAILLSPTHVNVVMGKRLQHLATPGSGDINVELAHPFAASIDQGKYVAAVAKEGLVLLDPSTLSVVARAEMPVGETPSVATWVHGTGALVLGTTQGKVIYTPFR